VTSGPTGGLQISNTSGPPLKRLSNLGRQCAVQPQYCIDINSTSNVM